MLVVLFSAFIFFFPAIDLLVCKLKHTWMSGVNSLVHQLRSMQKQSTFLHKSALWVKNQIQSSSLDVKR